MKTLVATALLAFASADDETSLMQHLVRSASNKLSASSGTQTSRQESTSKLLETAVTMIKSGVTPDVITFVDATNQDINDEVLVAIANEHAIDQAYIDSLCQDFLIAVQKLAEQAEAIAVHDANRHAASEAHHSCRAEEAFQCARSRRCEEQLRQKWVVVKHEESSMREIHGYIHDEWCVSPPFWQHDPPPIEDWLSHPFNWAQTSPYPILDLPQDVRDFRHVSVGYFRDYREQKIVTERAWLEYNEKLEECALREDAWEHNMEPCDEAQITAREHACSHAITTRLAREAFGQEWSRITTLFEQARIAKTANEQDRKNEWETLKIVQCLLDHVHSSVITSIDTGGPCPTIDSDPDGVTLAIEDCHIVTRGCGEDSMTAHLCLDWCEIPPPPPCPGPDCPDTPEPPCTPAYVAMEQAQFLQLIQASYTNQLASNNDYPNDPLVGYETVLSEAGWAGCAPPLVCVECVGWEVQEPCLEHTGGAHTCHLHEEYLSPGQSNADTFRCLDGTCISQAGRCNLQGNCADGSDESGCDADSNHFVPAYLSTSFACPADFHNDVHFRCASGECVEKVGVCNDIDNCPDGSDEAACFGGIEVTVEATSGRTISVETLQTNSGVFHDRSYHFDSLGHFAGKTFIKYSNDDKAIDHQHVMTKIRTLEPLTVYIVKLDQVSLPWLETEGYHTSSFTGVSFSGIRNTRHKEFDPSLLTTDSFAASGVFSKTFPAGTISIPGNDGGDGGFLIFLDRPSTEDEYDSRLTAYWEHGNCGVHGNDWNWHWCGTTSGNCPLTVATDLCPSGEAELAAYHGTGEAYSYHRNGCDYFWHAQYRCIPVPEVMGEELFIGCFVDDGARDLGAMLGNRDNAATNTFELCRAACGDSTYMSLQYGGECFCSNSYGNGAQYVEVDESECNANVQPCASSSYNCGGTWRQAIYQINNFDHWDLIAHHEVGGGWFSTGARSTYLENQNDPDAATFMNIGALTESDFLSNGAYHLKLVYTGVVEAATSCNDGSPLGPDGTQEFEWTQTSWITDTAATGYSKLTAGDMDASPNSGCVFSGLARSSQARTILDGSDSHGNWFHSIGSNTAWSAGIPSFKGGAAQGMSLYIKRPSNVGPEPEPDCGPLPQLTHAMWTQALQYHCEDGFSFDGSALTHALALQAECLPTGHYTEVRVCLPINDCAGHSCGAFGACRDLHMDYTCSCVEGFEMHTEQNTGEKICGNIDDCHGHVCGEAGVCVDLISDYECHCDEGWRQVVRHLDDLKTCERVECGEVPDIDNVMSMESTGLFPWTRSKAVFEDAVEYVCAPGFSTSGETDGARYFTVTCQANGEYTAPGQCLPVSCGAPEPAGGATPDNTSPLHFLDVVEYNCPTGYGPPKYHRLCLENGELSPAIACEALGCSEPPQFPQAQLTSQQPQYVFGQNAVYTCPEGYSTDPLNAEARTFELQCQANGWDLASVGGSIEWPDTDSSMNWNVVCVPVHCRIDYDETHYVSGGIDHPSYLGYPGAVHVQCADGYTQDGSAGGPPEVVSFCADSTRIGVATHSESPGSATGLPSCLPVTCPADNLMISLYSSTSEHRDFALGERATYTCNLGHEVANTDGASTFEVQCLRSGMFSAMSTCRNIDDCAGHSCGSSGSCVDGINEYTCDCDSGFEVEEVAGELMCGNIDDCGANACGSYGACHDLTNGYACECNLGYELQGEGSDQDCVAKTCPMPALDFVTTSATELRFPHTLIVECIEGHDLGNHADNFQIECAADGAMTSDGSATFPQCRPKVCGQPPQCGAENWEARDFRFGETSVSVCQGGDVEIVHECNADGVFHRTSQFTTCENSCGIPSVPAHAGRTDGADEVHHPASASYRCNNGYTLASGNEFSQTCRANGAFAAITETCAPVVCQRPAAPQHWEWVSGGSEFNTQNPLQLRCASGYTSSEADASEQFEVRCDAATNNQVGHHDFFSLPSPCQEVTVSVSGRIRNAIQPTQGVASAILVITTEAGQSLTVHTDSSGRYSVMLPAGGHSYSATAHSFITIPSGTMTIAAAGTFDITMSPELAADSWRIVLEWDQHPRDLDSHLQFRRITEDGEEDRCSEMYYGRRTATCDSVSASLDVDDTSSYGPETTTLSNVNSCSGPWPWSPTQTCKWVYKVKNYSGWYDRTHGWQDSQARVKLYNGDHMVREFEVNADHGHTDNNGIGQPHFWSVLSIDSHGSVEECANANCD